MVVGVFFVIVVVGVAFFGLMFTSAIGCQTKGIYIKLKNRNNK